MNNNQEDTICAIATAQGGAIGLIRVSGPQAIAYTSAIFNPIKSGKKLKDCLPYSLTYGHIIEGNETVDEVMVSLFKAPHSYTGEDSTEIACHGSSYILQKVIQMLIKQGCRLAQPGEYTQRAFLNGKMDLSQAEAVADLIAATSAATHRLAMNQMRGGFSKKLAELRDELLKFTALIELELDFSDHEDIEFADRIELRQLASHIEQVIAQLTQIKVSICIACIRINTCHKAIIFHFTAKGFGDCGNISFINSIAELFCISYTIIFIIKIHAMCYIVTIFSNNLIAYFCFLLGGCCIDRIAEMIDADSKTCSLCTLNMCFKLIIFLGNQSAVAGTNNNKGISSIFQSFIINIGIPCGNINAFFHGSCCSVIVVITDTVYITCCFFAIGKSSSNSCLTCSDTLDCANTVAERNRCNFAVGCCTGNVIGITAV